MKISDYPEDTIFVHKEYPPKYLLDPFEIIGHNDARYESALTREECAKEMERRDNVSQ